MEFVQVASKKTDVGSDQFWRAVDIWSRNPHVENRRILTSQEIVTVFIEKDATEICDKVEDLDFSSLELGENISETLLTVLTFSDYQTLEHSVDFVHLSCNGTYLRIAKVLPRNVDIFSPGYEFTIVTKSADSVIIIHKPVMRDKRCLGPDKAYMISHDRNGGVTRISVKNSGEASTEWLAQKLFPRLLKWMENELKSSPSVPASLSLVSCEEYATLYEILKKKYGTEMVKIWPENTDPKKFVYEDVAIATYLLILWKKERLEKGNDKLQSFVDLGCGNGLLVHILTSEGHPGIGIDLRKRKIWDLFPCRENLQVSTIVPSSMTLFPGTDWIIGNHSDELTPWVPVIAARTSLDCRFFLLPCCAYEFDGSKYQRNSAAKSQYSEYIEYVRTISEGCGFKTEMDRLRIPSTKRICLIGWDRMNKEEDNAKRDLQIEEIINARSTQKNETETVQKSESSWLCNFKPRDTVEKVRNCTRLDKTLLTNIVSIVADNLLRDGRRVILKELPDKSWNAGRELELSAIAELIPREMLSRLRKECGGLQTLLRNHGHIFNVNQGKVSFRVPGTDTKRRKTKKSANSIHRTKVKPCWFHENHPDGCPRTDENCSFIH